MGVICRFGAVLQLSAFQRDFNGLDIDLRGSSEARAELLLRCNELQDALWELCDQRMNDNDAQLRTLKYATALGLVHASTAGLHMFCWCISAFSATDGVCTSRLHAPAQVVLLPASLSIKRSGWSQQFRLLNFLSLCIWLLHLNPSYHPTLREVHSTVAQIEISQGSHWMSACEGQADDHLQCKRQNLCTK